MKAILYPGSRRAERRLIRRRGRRRPLVVFRGRSLYGSTMDGSLGMRRLLDVRHLGTVALKEAS